MILHFFIDPLIHTFMQNALIAALLVSSICAILSCYLVLKSWSLMGDAISHAVLPGIVLAFILKIPLGIGAFFGGMFCALGVGFLKDNSRIKEDTAMGIVFSGMFAFGIVLFAKIQSSVHLTHILFGNLLGVSRSEVWQTFFVSAFVFFIIILKRKDFLLYCFDPTQAKIVGISPKFLHYSLLMLLALTIVSAMQVVGVILVVAMLISPGITAFILTKRFDKMILIALLTSIFTSIFGTLLSFHIDGAVGPVIILLQALIFALALAYKKLFKQKLFNTSVPAL